MMLHFNPRLLPLQHSITANQSSIARTRNVTGHEKVWHLRLVIRGLGLPPSSSSEDHDLNTMRGETQPRRGVPNSGNTVDDAVEYARDIGENISDRIASGGWCRRLLRHIPHSRTLVPVEWHARVVKTGRVTCELCNELVSRTIRLGIDSDRRFDRLTVDRGTYRGI